MDRRYRLLQSLSGTAFFLALAGCQALNPWAKPAAPGGGNVSATQPLVKAEPAKPLTTEQKSDVQITMAQSLERDGRADEAQQVYESLIKKNPKSPEAYHRLALLHDKKGDGKKAEEYYRAALERDPKNADLLCDIGYSYYMQRRWSEAETRLRQALAIDPKLIRAENNLGLVLAHTERHELALAAFMRGGSQAADAHVNLAYCLLWEKQREPAEKQLQLALRADPNSKSAGDALMYLKSGGANEVVTQVKSESPLATQSSALPPGVQPTPPPAAAPVAKNTLRKGEPPAGLESTDRADLSLETLPAKAELPESPSLAFRPLPFAVDSAQVANPPIATPSAPVQNQGAAYTAGRDTLRR